ncbi:MAG: hypothetical protein QM493_11275 [Sulfurovum sp.]
MDSIKDSSHNINPVNFNPFSSSKVDDPFQEHFDDLSLYRDEFKNLLGIVKEIKNDTNAQTKTALVIGEAGNGKTHLMMRFLRSVSKTNRFLFVGKPNNKDSILFHTYTKILESFIQKIDESPYSQLEYLLAKSFSAIIIEFSKNSKVIETLKKNHLNIYENFGGEGTDRRRNNWKILERNMLKWHRDNYGSDPISINILKALIKYTYYKDENKKDIVISYLSGRELDIEVLNSVDLEAWSSINLEEFSLKAISLFGKLSIFDEPLIISFDQLEAMSSDEDLLLSFGESVKELITVTPNSLVILNLFPNRWIEYEALFDGSFIDLVGKNRIMLETPNSRELKNMLQRRALASDIDLDILFEDRTIYKDILKQNSIRRVLNRASDYYKLYTQNIPLPKEIIVSLEDKVEALIKRIAYLEAREGIEHSPIEIKTEFNIERYINKIHSQKLKEYDKKSIIDDKQDIDKLKYILNSLNEIYPIEINAFKSKRVLPEHIIIKTEKFSYVVGFLHLEGRLFVSRIKNFNELLEQHPEYYFRLFRDRRESIIKGKTSKDEQDRLNNSPNGKFMIMLQDDRVIYETIYQLIIDLQNRDIELPLKELMESIFALYKDFWLCKLLDN